MIIVKAALVEIRFPPDEESTQKLTASKSASSGDRAENTPTASNCVKAAWETPLAAGLRANEPPIMHEVQSVAARDATATRQKIENAATFFISKLHPSPPCRRNGHLSPFRLNSITSCRFASKTMVPQSMSFPPRDNPSNRARASSASFPTAPKSPVTIKS